MRILFLSFYFPPDLCAGSFRSGALVRSLVKYLSANDRIDVMTALPNRYASYHANAPAVERNGSLFIHRFAVPKHHSGMGEQALAYSCFAGKVLKKTSRAQYDLVFATTSRLMTGLLGAMIAKRVNAPLYLDIRDIFPDTMKDILAGSVLRGTLPFFRWIERYTVNSATRINLVSEGFISYFESIRPGFTFAFHPNGVDSEFIENNYKKSVADECPLILYAGNLGEGQGLHHIVPQAAKMLEGRCRFLLVGDGGKRQELEDKLKLMDVSNVEVIDPVPRHELVQLYACADYLFLHLNDYNAFHKVLPSKIFEYAATGKPILAGVSGYARLFIQNHVVGAEVFEPCDARGLVSAIDRLPVEQVNRDKFVAQYSRSSIMDRLAKDILGCVSA